MKTINVGVIGYGWAAAAHIAAINATRQGQVTAVYSSRPLDAAELSAKHASGVAGNRIKTYQNLSEMLADPSLHAVDINRVCWVDCITARSITTTALARGMVSFAGT